MKNLYRVVVIAITLAMIAGAAQAAGNAKKSPLDKDLAMIADIGSSAEVIYENVNAGKWKPVAGRIKHIRTALLNSDMARIIGGGDAKRINTALDAIETAAAARDKKSAMIAANKLTKIGIEIAGRYNPAIPVGIELMSYYGRELQIYSAAKDTAKLQSTIKDIRRTWDMVKGPVRENGGAVEEKAFSLLVLGLEKASASAEIVRIYPLLLEQVGRLEKVFDKKQ
ncbi:MAG: hypothetical protein WCX65_16460 [bacterium]